MVKKDGPPLPLQADRRGGGAAAQVRQAAEEEEAASGGQQTETGAGAEQGWFWLIFNNQRY